MKTKHLLFVLSCLLLFSTQAQNNQENNLIADGNDLQQQESFAAAEHRISEDETIVDCMAVPLVDPREKNRQKDSVLKDVPTTEIWNPETGPADGMMLVTDGALTNTKLSG